MRIYKRKNSPFWYFEFMVNGRAYRGSTKRKDQVSANRVLAMEYNRVMNIQQFGEKPEISIHDAMQRTVESVTGSTRDSYQNSMNKLLGLRERFEGLWTLDSQRALSSLTECDLEDHLQARVREGFKPNSINIEVRFLKRVNNLCSKRFRVNTDLDFTQLEGFQKSRSLSPDEENAVVIYCRDKMQNYEDASAWQKAHDLFIYLIDTGVRLGEALSVEWADIDLKDRLIDNYNHKTRKSVFVPISDRLHGVLLRLHNQPKPFERMERAVRNLRRAIAECCPASERVLREKGKATIHSCRDTYATRMLNAGLSLDEVSHLLGHSDIKTTMKYAKFDKRKIADKARERLSA